MKNKRININKKFKVLLTVILLVLWGSQIVYGYINNSLFDYNGGEYKEYLSDIKTRATGWYTSTGSIYLDEDAYGDNITMLSNNVEVVYDKGLWLHGDALLTYTNIQDYGYETFESYIGVNKSAWDLVGEKTSFVFEFIIDGETVYKSDIFYNNSEQEFVSIDISDASVFQIKVDSLGSVGDEHAVMGDAMFIRSEGTPYLYVFDLEFNQSDQVTESNLLEYAVAKNYNDSDISNKITYTTNFYEGGVGEFDITYTVTCNEGYTTSRDVKIIVTDEDYSENITLERMRMPWADYMYHPRQTMDAQNQSAFDFILESVLDFDVEDGEYVTNKANLAYKFTINLLDNGIYVNSYYIKNMTSILYDAEPRVWLLRKWTQEYTTKNGLVDTVTFYMTYAYLNEEDEYNQINQLILDNSNTFLENAKDDMTYQQKFYYTVNAYAKWIVYNDGGELIHSMAYGYGKCGGNAMGVVFLAHRLNIKSNYGDGNVGESGFHGWSYQKMPEEDGWYFTDTLWGRMLNSPNDDTYDPYYGNGIYTWFEENENTYSSDKKKYTYPSVWIELEYDIIHLVKGDAYNFLDNIQVLDSIYDNNVQLSDVVLSIKYKDDSDSPYISMGNCIDDVLKAGDNLLRGEYIVTYTVDYNGFHIEADALLIVTDEIVEDNDYNSLTGSYNAQEGVYDGENEVYGSGFALNNSSYVVLNVEDKNYQTISFLYSAKAYVRTDNWAITYAKMYLEVYFDGVLVHTTSTKTAFSSYDSITIEIPEGTKEITLANVSLGQGSHGAVININYGYSEDSSNEYPVVENSHWVVTREPTYLLNGVKKLIGDCGCVIQVSSIEKLVIDESVEDESNDELEENQVVPESNDELEENEVVPDSSDNSNDFDIVPDIEGDEELNENNENFNNGTSSNDLSDNDSSEDLEEYNEPESNNDEANDLKIEDEIFYDDNKEFNDLYYFIIPFISLSTISLIITTIIKIKKDKL